MPNIPHTSQTAHARATHPDPSDAFGPLVTTAWLAGHIGTPGLVVLDATVLREPFGPSPLQYVRRPAVKEYEADGHIPGARFADLVNTFSDPHARLPLTKPSAAQLADAARTHGIGRETRVVIYDTLDGIWAARVWWVLRAYGHEHVAVLDGGLQKWRNEGRPIEKGASAQRVTTGISTDVSTGISRTPAKSSISAESDIPDQSNIPDKPDEPDVPGASSGASFIPFTPFAPVENPRAFVDREYVLRMIDPSGSGEALLCNALRRPVFTGAEQAYARPGRIPQSLSTPYGELVDAATNALLPHEILRERLAAVLDNRARIVTYCGGGIAAAGLALALTLCGHADIAIYDGSLNEWAADPALPLIVD